MRPRAELDRELSHTPFDRGAEDPAEFPAANSAGVRSRPAHPAVLVHHGNTRNALLIARDLCGRGVRVDLAASRSDVAGRFSRFVSAFHLVPDLYSQPSAFVAAVGAICRRRGISLFLPSLHEVFTLAPFQPVLRRYAYYPFACSEVIRRVDDKAVVSRTAQAAGLCVPSFIEVSAAPDNDIRLPFDFPVVYKPVVSSAARGFGIAPNREALMRALRSGASDKRWLIQQYIRGRLLVWEGIAHDGRIEARFQFEVLRTHPACGGASVFRRSIMVPKLDECARRLIQATGYEGFCTLDFIQEQGTGRLFFLDFNPRFGTSLHASLAAGVSFPYLLLQIAMGEHVSYPTYPLGVTSFSLVGHVRRLLGRRANGPTFLSLLKDLVSCLLNWRNCEERWLEPIPLLWALVHDRTPGLLRGRP
jgi:predicted ATP-grasp superfamily ATP-dependent carboligase